MIIKIDNKKIERCLYCGLIKFDGKRHECLKSKGWSK